MDRKVTRSMSKTLKKETSYAAKNLDQKKTRSKSEDSIQVLQSTEETMVPTAGTSSAEVSKDKKRKSLSNTSPNSKRLCQSLSKPVEKSNQCELCSEWFKNKSGLGLHMKSVHQSMPIVTKKRKKQLSAFKKKKYCFGTKEILETDTNIYEKSDKFSDWKLLKTKKVASHVNSYEILPNADQLFLELNGPNDVNTVSISSDESDKFSKIKSVNVSTQRNFHTKLLENPKIHRKESKRSKKIKSSTSKSYEISKKSLKEKKSFSTSQKNESKFTKLAGPSIKIEPLADNSHLPSIKIEPLSDDSQDVVRNSLNHSENRVVKVKTEPELDFHDLNILIPKIELSVSETEIDSEEYPSHSIFDSSNQEDFDSDENEDVMCYRCPYCMLINDRHDFFRKHFSVSKNCKVEIYKVSSNESQNLQPTSCNVCNTKFSNFEIFTHHMNTHKLNVCTVCDHSFVYLCELSRHQVLKKHDIDIFKCYACDDKFGMEIRLREHFTSTHPDLEVSFSCQICNTLFLTSEELLEHCNSILKTELPNVKNDYHKTKVAYFRQLKYHDGPCHEMDFKNDVSLIQIAIKDLKANTFSCYVCKNKYSNINYLDQHFVTMHLTQYLNDQSNTTLLAKDVNTEEIDDKNVDNSKEECEVEPFESVILDEKQIKVEPEEISNEINEENSILEIVHIKTEKIKTQNIKKNPIKIKSIQLKIENPASENCSINLPSTSCMHTNKIINNTSADDQDALGFFFESDSSKNQTFTEKFKNSIFTVSYKPTVEEEVSATKSEIVIIEDDITNVENPNLEEISVNELDGSYWCEICESKVYPEHKNVQHAPVQKVFEPFPCPDCHSVFNTFIELKNHSMNFHPTSKKIFPYRKTGIRKDRRRRCSEYDDIPGTSETSQIVEEKASVTKKLQNKIKAKHSVYYSKLRLKNNPKKSKSDSNYFINTLGDNYFQTIEINEESTQGEILTNTEENEYFLEYFYFKCHVCNKKFKESDNYIEHFTAQHKDKAQFKCFICDEIFNSHTFRTMHFKQHSEVVINCTNCNQDIQHNVFFRRHFKTCMENKCSFCVSSVENLDDLCTHSRKHVTLSNNVYECKLCHNCFFTNYNLENHFKSIHAINLTHDK